MDDSPQNIKLQAETDKIIVEKLKLNEEVLKIKAEKLKIEAEYKEITKPYWKKISWIASFSAIILTLFATIYAIRERIFQTQNLYIEAKKELLKVESKNVRDTLIVLQDSLVNFKTWINDSLMYYRRTISFFDSALKDTTNIYVKLYDKIDTLSVENTQLKRLIKNLNDKLKLNYSTHDSFPGMHREPSNDSIYLAEDGKRIYETKHSKPANYFLIRTSGKPISMELLVKELRSGSFFNIRQNLMRLPNLEQQEMMMAIVREDNGKGGTGTNNNREYGGYIEDDQVIPYPPSAVSHPCSGTRGFAARSGKENFHSHPSGSYSQNGRICGYYQEPSETDIKAVTPGKQEYVFAMAEKVVYVYNSNGILATIPFSYWGRNSSSGN